MFVYNFLVFLVNCVYFIAHRSKWFQTGTTTHFHKNISFLYLKGLTWFSFNISASINERVKWFSSYKLTTQYTIITIHFLSVGKIRFRKRK